MLGVMGSAVAHGSGIGEAFRVPDARTMTARTLDKSTVTLTEVRGGAGHGVTQPIAHDDAFLVALQVAPCPGHELFFEGRHVKPRDFHADVTAFYDLRRDPVAELRDPFHGLMFYLPRAILRAAAEEEGLRCDDDLRYPLGAGIQDSVVSRLLTSLRPALERPREASAVFVDYVASSLCHHVARTYGGMPRPRPRGALAPWQERRVKEMLEQDLAGDAPLSRYAAECGLSVRHFGRAFRQSTGMPPHRWLTQRRIERAQRLLRDPRLSLPEVALACGFADQSHFTRVFSATVGMSPGAWRRAA